jgi:hypothetical protein
MSDKRSIILKLSVVVLTILIILLVWDGCSKKALLSAYKKQMSQLEFTNQSFEEIVNKDGKKIIQQEQLILSQKDAIQNNFLDLDKMKKVQSQVRIKNVFHIDSVFIPYTDTFIVENTKYKSFIFGVNNDSYNIYGKTNEDGILIDSLSFYNNMKITIGNKSMGFFKASKPIVQIDNTNPFINTTSVQNIVIKNELKWWDKKITWFTIGTGLGIVGGILLIK